MSNSPLISVVDDDDSVRESLRRLIRDPANSSFSDDSLLIQLYSTARKLAIERSQENTEDKWPHDGIEEGSVETVRQSIKALPPLERETLILFEYEGLSIRYRKLRAAGRIGPCPGLVIFALFVFDQCIAQIISRVRFDRPVWRAEEVASITQCTIAMYVEAALFGFL